MTQEIVTIYTDGACLGNPGRGGWAAILECGNTQKELSGGFRRTTNNRMELLAVIEGLTALTKPCAVRIVTDSRYVHDAIEKKWLNGWVRRGWVTASKTPVKNVDLWKRLMPYLEKHDVNFSWVRGHTGHPQNERCDVLAKRMAEKPGQPEDAAYVA